MGARNLKGEWSHREFCVDGPSDSSFVLGAPWGGGGPSVQVVSEVSSRLDGREWGAGGGQSGGKASGNKQMNVHPSPVPLCLDCQAYSETVSFVGRKFPL